MMKERLKELREELGYTQQEVAERLNVARHTISMYETGRIEPSFSSMVKLADMYNCSLDYLACRTKERYNVTLFDKDTQKFISEVVSKFKIKSK